MSWHLHEIKRKTKTYISLQKNQREGKKIGSNYIYLGPIDKALKIFADLQIKPLENEKEVSYSGEMILGSISTCKTPFFFSELRVPPRFVRKYTLSDWTTLFTNISILNSLFSVERKEISLNKICAFLRIN